MVELAAVRPEAVVAGGWCNLLEELREEVVDRVLRDEQGWNKAAREIQCDLDWVHGHPAPGP